MSGLRPTLVYILFHRPSHRWHGPVSCSPVLTPTLRPRSSGNMALCPLPVLTPTLTPGIRPCVLSPFLDSNPHTRDTAVCPLILSWLLPSHREHGPVSSHPVFTPTVTPGTRPCVLSPCLDSYSHTGNTAVCPLTLSWLLPSHREHGPVSSRPVLTPTHTPGTRPCVTLS
jgi:hypothetical protein